MSRAATCRLGRRAALSALLGLVASGPLALLLVQASRPQPPWRDAALYARSFHDVQLLPYVFGLFLVAGLLLVIVALHRLASEEQRTLTTAALAFAVVFATLIFGNYIVQTTFLPALARDYRPENDGVIGMFAMANPKALAWAVEMWGYAFYGVATILVAPVLAGGALGRWTARCLVANGVVSLAGGVWTAAAPGWVHTGPGLAAFTGWNLLVAIMCVLVAIVCHRRAAGGEEPGLQRSGT